MHPETGRYLDLVRQGRNEWWRYALGVPVILVFWLVLGNLPYLLIAGIPAPDPMAVYVAINFSLVMMLAGLALVVRVLHRRPLMSLVAPARRPDWTRIARAAAWWGAFALVAAAVEHVLYPGRYYVSFDPQRYFMFAALVLVLTPVQTTAEELLFRGYLMQALGLLARHPAVIAVLSAAIFMLPHLMNPEVQQYGAAVLAGTYFVIGLLLAAITLRDGRLELAIGLHAANNLVLALFANYEGSVLATESVFTARELDPAYSLVTFAVGAALFYWRFFLRGRRLA